MKKIKINAAKLQLGKQKISGLHIVKGGAPPVRSVIPAPCGTWEVSCLIEPGGPTPPREPSGSDHSCMDICSHFFC